MTITTLSWREAARKDIAAAAREYGDAENVSVA